MSKNNCYFFDSITCNKILTPATWDSLELASDDTLVIWHDGDLFLAYNANIADGKGVFLSYEDLRHMATLCLEDNSFRKGSLEVNL